VKGELLVEADQFTLDAKLGGHKLTGEKPALDVTPYAPLRFG